MTLFRSLVTLLALLALVEVTACVRDAREFPCSAPEPGSLVLSELRAEGAGDLSEEWIEIYNPGTAFDLFGVELVTRTLDGARENSAVVLEEGLQLSTGGRVVLGYTDGEVPAPHITVALDHPLLFSAGAIELRSCGVTLDTVIYRDLPQDGSWSFDGSVDPDASANDEESRWCVDPGGDGVLGTPGATNSSCIIP